MNKGISLERLYSLGDYRNIKFTVSIDDVPQDVAANPAAMNLLWYLQLLEVEEARFNYDLISRKIHETSHEDISAMLEEERTQTYLDFLAEIEDKTNTD